jgi:hypothetical protein
MQSRLRATGTQRTSALVFVGYVLEFEVDSEYLRRFDVHKAGSNIHLEYWIPAAELAEFNLHIRGEIRVISKFTSHAQDKK